MITIYKPEIPRLLEEFYRDILYKYNDGISVKEHLSLISEKLWIGIQDKYDPVYAELNNYNKKFIGQTREQLKRVEITKGDCYETIANEYGFTSWRDLDKGADLIYNQNFERAIEFILAGNLASLKESVRALPDIVKERSPYGHKATLLHYCASNGIEFWRQVVPSNLAEITQFLINSGADVESKMFVYGGEFDTLSLLNTSAHPYKAGVIDQMRAVLLRI